MEIKTITLNFIIFSFYMNKNKNRMLYKKYYKCKMHDSKTKLKIVLKEIYKEFMIFNKKKCSIMFRYNCLFKNYFKSSLRSLITLDNKKIDNMTLDELEFFFTISKMKLDILVYLDEIGDAVCNYEGIKLFFHTNEKDLHHKPHIHCKYSGQSTRIDLNTLQFIDNSLPKSQSKKVIKLLSKNKVELLE